tara:strand:+ start:50 stop:1015 length:966 start_codon:yes stop_codon:yes gene_type:complete
MANWMDELERLGELRDKGLLTVEEFEAAKENLLRSRNEKAVENETAENEASEIPAHDEKEETQYTLIITEPIPHEDQAEAITILRDEIDGLNYHGAKDLLSNTPSIPSSFKNVSRERCETLQAKLERTGVSVSVLTQDQFMKSSFHNVIGPGKPKSGAGQDEKHFYYIRLINLGKRKNKVHRVLNKIYYCDQEIFDWFALNVPITIARRFTLGEALKIKKKFQEAGAFCTLKNQTELGDDLKYLNRPEFQNTFETTEIQGLKCPHCGEAGQCIQTHRTKFRQDTTRGGSIFGSKTWQQEMNVQCNACGLTSTIKGSSHYGI